MAGTFILRIEDTDLQRSSAEMVEGILEGMKWLGLDYDEGPFFQSDFVEEHRAAARQLLESGHAYRDFTPKQERSDVAIKQQIAEAARQPGVLPPYWPYRELSRAESDARAAAGEPFVIRFKVPTGGTISFDDSVFGRQERECRELEDLVLLRSDGHPLYNLSVVVDDISMGITHVIRGQDHLMNTHKQVLIYQALGKPVPRFAHLPLILAPSREKLSKRKHGEIVSVTTYRDRGFIPAAFLNFLALLGWSPDSSDHKDREIFARSELIDLFSLDQIHKSNAIFNFNEGDARNWTDQKALWMNGEYIRSLSPEDLLPLVRVELEKAGIWQSAFADSRRSEILQTIGMLRDRYRSLIDFATLGRPYIVDGLDFEWEEAAVTKNLRRDPVLRDLLPELALRFAGLQSFDHETTESILRSLADEKGVKAGLLINAARTALTGQAVGPGMFDVFVAIGQARSVERLRYAASLV